MRYLFLFFLLLTSRLTQAQTGNYFLQHYAPEDEGLDHVCFDMVQDGRGVVYFATRSGILRFDGQNWDMIDGGGAVYALEINSEGQIFWAGARGFGIVSQSNEGTAVLQKLSQSQDQDFYQAVATGENVYFLSDQSIFLLKENRTTASVQAKNFSGSFIALFELFGIPYVSTDGADIFKIEGTSLVTSSLNLPQNTEVVFSSRFENQYLVGTADSRLFLCSGEALRFREIDMEDKQYLEAGVVVGGAWVNRHRAALGTLRGGVVFFNPATGRTEEIVNYNTGLPDNEIFTIMCDPYKNIWVAHEYGFTRISPFLPFRSFSHYDGLRGNLLCATLFNDNVYVGTSLGLFKLERQEVYEEIVYYVDVVVKEAAKEEPSKPNVSNEGGPTHGDETEPEKTAEKKRGFLRFLKRNKDAARESAPATDVKSAEGDVPAQKGQSNEAERYVTKKLKKTERVLRSSNYVYKKVDGVEAKVTHLAEVNGKLVASGLGGVFEIHGLQSASILEQPARFMFPYKKDLVVISTYADRPYTFRHNGARWERTSLLENIDDQITFVFEGNDDEIWLCATDRIYRLEVEDDLVKDQAIFELASTDFSKTVGMYLNDHIVLANSGGIYQVDRDHNQLVRIDSLPAPKAYFASAGALWYHDDHTWNLVSQARKQTNIHLLNIFPDLRFIASSQSDNLWIITGNNELYKFFGEKLSLNQAQYPLFVRSIRHAERKISSDKKIKVEEGVLTIEVVKPDFAGANAVEYRYFLKGLNKEWSAWSRNNDEMNFPYLPPGKYTLEAQSRDIFGLVTDMHPLEIEVVPPYWKRPWFYAMEFSVFALLVLLSLRLSVRYRFISRILSLLTIILFIEFIQTVAGYTFSTNSSPVVDFLIQVVVAFMILPIEGYLRNLMFKSTGSGSRLYQIISDMNKQSKITR